MDFASTAGTISTLIFMVSNVPMLIKAAKTRSLKSYSFTYILMNNAGNLIHWLYIAHLPIGPIWFLHGFYTVTTLLMMIWYVRYEGFSFRNRLAKT